MSPYLMIAVLGSAIGASLLIARVLPRRYGWRALTVCAGLLLGLSAIGLRLDAGGDGETFLVIDVSASTGLTPPDPGELMSRAGLDPEQTRVLVFGESPVWLSGRDGRGDRVPVDGASLAGMGGSNLAAALLEVAREAGAGDEVVVFTDGRTWSRDLDVAGGLVRTKGARIRILSFGRRWDRDVRVRAVRAPSRVPRGMGVNLEVLVEGAPGSRGSLDIRVDGVRKRRVGFGLGDSGSERMSIGLRELEPGYRTIAATLFPPDMDELSENDHMAAGLVVGDSRRVMLVSAPVLRPLLESMGFDVIEESEPVDLGHLDLLVLGNVRAGELPSGGRGVRDFVKGGGGLLVLGGPDTFGPGGYSGRPIEECLPLRSRPDEEGLRLVLLLDCSGSMNRPFREGEAVSKSEMARDASLTLGGILPEGTQVSVVRFSTEIFGVPKQLEAGRAGFQVKLRRELEPSHERARQTRFEPPLRWALDAMNDGGVSRSLVLLVTDGQLVGDESAKRLIDLARGIPAAPGRHRFHVLAVGEDADLSFLSRLAGSEDAFTLVSSERRMTGGLIDALLSAEGEGLLVERREAVVDRRVPGAPFAGTLPAVSGLVRTYARGGAEVWYSTENGDPLIAGWRFGLGIAVGISTDPLGDWAAEWAGTKVLAALADHAARSLGRGGRRVAAAAAEDRLRLSVHCDAEQASLRGRLLTSGGRTSNIELTAAGEGRFTGEIPRPPPGAARLTLEDGRFDGGLTLPYANEYRHSGPDPAGIARLRDQLGHDAPRGHAGIPVGHWFALLGLLVFLLDRFLISRGSGWLFLKRTPPGVR